MESIPIHDPLWTSKYGGADLTSVMRRDPQPAKAGRAAAFGVAGRSARVEGHSLRRPLRRDLLRVRPELRLEKHDSAECRGYTREDAARIGLNVLRYAIQR